MLKKLSFSSLMLVMLISQSAFAEGGKLKLITVQGQGSSDYCEQGWLGSVCTDIGMESAAKKAAREDAKSKAEEKCLEMDGTFEGIQREHTPYGGMFGNTYTTRMKVTAKCRVPEVEEKSADEGASESSTARIMGAGGSRGDLVEIDGQLFRVGADGQPKYVGPMPGSDGGAHAGSAEE